MRFVVINDKKRVVQINEIYGENIDSIEEINNRLSSGFFAVEIQSNEKITLDHYYCNGRFEEVTAIADKTTIAADGVDIATVTAKVPAVLSEITFYHADTGEPISTVPVAPETQTATLQVAATTPGAIRIRAGEPTMTRLNEVIIHAVEAS